MGVRPDPQHTRVEREPLKPVYLVAGEEILRVQELADAIRARARAEGFAEREVFHIDERFNWDEIEGALSALSLFSTRRIFELRLPTAKPGKAGGQFIEKYCADPPPDTLLLILGGEWSSKHGGKWSQAVAQAGHAALLKPLRGDELPQWLRDRMQRVGLQADPAAVAVLVERVEGNLLAASQEIDKLALLHPGARLDAESMAAAVADSARYNVFGLVEATLAGDARRVVRVLAALRAEGGQVPGLMGWIVTELKRLALLAGVQASGGNMAQAFRASGVWDSRKSEYQRLLRRHPASTWERFAIECGRIDRMSKGREDGDPWLALERLLVAVAQSPAAGLVDA
jgi:DNA polymerase III subunit delta